MEMTTHMNLLLLIAAFSMTDIIPKVSSELQIGGGELNVTSIAYDVCRYNTFCDVSNKSVPLGYHSCCGSCSCSEDCLIGNRCCPDSPHAEHLQSGGSCKPQSEYFDFHRENVLIDVGYYNNYYVVDTCPDDYDDDDDDADGDDDAAVNGCLNPSTIEEHVFVSDPETVTIYKNYQCARCNGVNKYESWQLMIFCHYNDALASVTKRDEYILNKCSLVSVPPEGRINFYSPLKCFHDAIDSCNMTGYWDVYNADLERACFLYNMPYKNERVALGRHIMTYKIYKNVFCFMCNMNEGTVASSECLGQIKSADSGKDSMFGSGAFTALFDLRKQHVDLTRACNIDEVEDPLLGKCTKLYCPFGKVALNGYCLEGVKYIYVTLVATYKLEFPTTGNNNDSPDLYNNLIDAFVSNIVGKFDGAGCDLCQLELFINDFAIFRVSTTERCPLTKLLKVYKYLAKMTTLSLTVHGKLYDIHMKQSAKNVPFILKMLNFSSGIAVTRRSVDGKKSCSSGAQLIPKFYCKRITYTLGELVEGEVTNETIDHVLESSEMLDKSHEGNLETEYVICLNDYRAVRNRATFLQTRNSWQVYAFLGMFVWILSLVMSHNDSWF